MLIKTISYKVITLFILSLLIASQVVHDKTNSSGYTLFFKAPFKKPVKNSYFVFEINEDYYYKNKKLPTRLIKKIITNKTDKVRIDNKGIFVNDLHLTNSKRMIGVTSKEASKMIINKNSCYVAYINNDRSFDSRYFGCVEIENASQLIPLI